MILGIDKEEIVRIAVESQCPHMADGVANFDYDNNEVCGACYSVGETENPLNHLIEIFRFSQNDDKYYNYECDDCPYVDNEDERIECCFDVLLDGLVEELEDNIEDIEFQVREVFSDYLGDTIRKLNEIRIGISDILTFYKTLEVRSDDWEMGVMDSYVDNAVLYGFSVDELRNPCDYLDAEIQGLINQCEYADKERKLLSKVASYLKFGDLDGAIDFLNMFD